MVAELRAGFHTRTNLHAQTIEKQGERSAGKAVFGRKLEIRFGGASRDRTDGLVVANDALSQLSYSPTLVLGWACSFYQCIDCFDYWQGYRNERTVSTPCPNEYNLR